MSQDKTTSSSGESNEIHPQASPFEMGYQPETLPQISVPNLDDDALGLSAEALANVPTLTEQVDAPTAAPEVIAAIEAIEPALVPAVASDEPVVQPQPPEMQSALHVEPIQEAPAQADTWGEALHARMGKLNGDIETLNARLDRLEERNKAKV